LSQLTNHAKVIGRLRALACVMAGPAVTVLLSVAAMAQALKVWQWRLGDPVDFTGDSPLGLAQLKNILDHGWSGSNPNLGAPFYQDASWFPHADHLHLFLAANVIGLFSKNGVSISVPYASRHTTAWVDERQDHNRWGCDGTLGGFRHRNGDLTSRKIRSRSARSTSSSASPWRRFRCTG
jgi:hypothetical protein